MIRHTQFVSPANGLEEHFFAGSAPCTSSFGTDLDQLLPELDRALAAWHCTREDIFLLRFHLSDPTNQAPCLKDRLKGSPAFVSVVGQAPLNSRIAAECWCIRFWRTMKNYTPFWFRTDTVKEGSYAQTEAEFAELDSFLASHGLDMELNTVRTWLYCRDVDNNYAGLVKARNDCFDRKGLTSETHFIASTGIEGQCPEPHRLVRMDTLSFSNLKHEQFQFLYALDHLSPTALYGVRFERGTKLLWGDRAHFIISGTASIDREGRVLFTGDVRRQTARVMENVGALLAERGGKIGDIKWGTLYLRDIADSAIVLEELAKGGLSPEIPLVVLKAPVCRPAWLVELECVAVKAENNPFPVFA